MATLLERARQVISVEVDDFFEDDTILYYLNKSMDKVTSQLIQAEYTPNRDQQGVARGSSKSIRALDTLRKLYEITISENDLEPVIDYYTGSFSFPSDMVFITLVRYETDTFLREISPHKLFLLSWGNLRPSRIEGYYHVKGNSEFDVFLHEKPKQGETKKISISFIKRPERIELNSEELPELVDRLTNAVVYSAAIMMLTQEAIRETAEGHNLQGLMNIYQEELQSNLY